MGGKVGEEEKGYTFPPEGGLMERDWVRWEFVLNAGLLGWSAAND